MQSSVKISNTRIRVCMVKNDDIDELFQEAMKDDEDWYNSFVRDVLGEDKDIRETSIDAEKEKTSEANTAEPNVPLSSDYRKWKIGETEKDGTDEKDPVQPPASGSERVDEIPNDTVASKRKGEDDGKPESSSQESRDDIFIQYEDMYGDTQRLPYSIFEKLGYRIPDLTNIQAEVLELIVEDNIPMPKRGIPERWIIQDPENKEVLILRKRQKSLRRQDTERLSQGKKYRQKFDDDREIRSNRKVVDMKDQPRARRIKKRQRSLRSNEKLDSIWMDISSFKNYLRREAEFRLSILGPEWEDWVKGESQWRLDLYKKWLDLVEDGYGKDLMDDLYTVPPNERRKQKAKRPKPTTAGKRERPPESILSDRPMRQRPTWPTVSRNVGRSKRSRGFHDPDDDRFDRDMRYRKTRSGKENMGSESNFNAIEDYVVGRLQDNIRGTERGLDDIGSFSDQYSDENLEDLDGASSITSNKYRSVSRNWNRNRARQEHDTNYRKINKNASE